MLPAEAIASDKFINASNSLEKRATMTPEDELFKIGRSKGEKESCPYITEEHSECYFMKMDSRSIESAVFYCLRNFTQCRIYEGLALKNSIDQ